MPLLKDRMYDTAKWSASIFLPALNVLWLAIAPVWGVDADLVQKVSVTIAGFNAFLGALVGVSNAQYNKERAERKKK